MPNRSSKKPPPRQDQPLELRARPEVQDQPNLDTSHAQIVEKLRPVAIEGLRDKLPRTSPRHSRRDGVSGLNPVARSRKLTKSPWKHG